MAEKAIPVRDPNKRRLSIDQLQDYNDAFVEYDQKQRRHISNDQFKALLRSTGYNPTELEVNRMCWGVDYNDNGKVDFDEFLDLMSNIKSNEKDDKSYLDAFRAFDIHNKGYARASDIREVLLDVMAKKSKTDKELIMKVFHLDRDRKVTFEDFKLMISSPM